MNRRNNLVIHIPARSGSKRVKSKNLRMLANTPLISYAINAALKSNITDQVYVNTDCEKIEEYANSLGVKVYRRDPDLASDLATSDEFNYDIINNLNPTTLMMINPVCPLINERDINEVYEYFLNNNFDTLITCNQTYMQCFYNNKPINIDIEKKLAPTQDNIPVNICNWAISIWDAEIFKKNFIKKGFAVFGDKLKLYPISNFKSIKISIEEDFIFAEKIIKSLYLEDNI